MFDPRITSPHGSTTYSTASRIPFRQHLETLANFLIAVANRRRISVIALAEKIYSETLHLTQGALERQLYLDHLVGPHLVVYTLLDHFTERLQFLPYLFTAMERLGVCPHKSEVGWTFADIEGHQVLTNPPAPLLTTSCSVFAIVPSQANTISTTPPSITQIQSLAASIERIVHQNGTLRAENAQLKDDLKNSYAFIGQVSQLHIRLQQLESENEQLKAMQIASSTLSSNEPTDL